MKPEYTILLKLVRAGLCPCGPADVRDIPDTSVTDWDALLDYAMSQGVAYIASDGLSALAEAGVHTSLDGPGNEDIRLEWLGEQMKGELEFEDYRRSLGRLVRYMVKGGAGRIMVMKGYAAALNFPHPSHRSFGDMDIFSLDGKSDAVDALLSKFPGYESRRDNEGKHSHATFDGCSVENHFRFLGGGAREREMEEVLMHEALANSRPVDMDGATVYVPSATFNAIFLICHMAAHFTLENVSLRQLCDWWMFLRRESAQVDWNTVVPLLERGGRKAMFDLVNGVLVRFFGMEGSLVPPFDSDGDAENRFISFVMDAAPLRTSGVEAVLKYWRRRWNFRVAYGENWTSALLRSVAGHLGVLKCRG